MIDITNCNKIIVDTIGKTEKIIEWYQQNKDWLDAEEFRIPIPSALVELPEEDIKFYYEQEGVFVRLHLYMGGVYFSLFISSRSVITSICNSFAAFFGVTLSLFIASYLVLFVLLCLSSLWIILFMFA